MFTHLSVTTGLPRHDTARSLRPSRSSSTTSSGIPDLADSPRTALDVQVTGGTVRGVRDGSIVAWRGIPYAAPPVGPLRFRAPQSVIPWCGVRDASRHRDVASQIPRNSLRSKIARQLASEDCLTINVLAPTVGRRTRLSLPVMVFIHGGGYSIGSAQDFPQQGPSFVRTGRVVYVNFNYRLGALGYLDFSGYSTPERPIENNLGLRDQLAALEWVRSNIRSFGGNPNNVTVFGESAGGNAALTLMATPAARGLFARVIAQSPPPGAAYAPELTRGWAEEVVNELRAITPDAVGETSDAAQLLIEADAGQLMLAALAVQVRTPDAQPGTFCLAPVVDGDLLPEHPVDAFRRGHTHHVPLIIGTNYREGSAFGRRVDILPQSPQRIQALFERAPEGTHDAMRAAYPGLPTKHAASDFGGDFAFWFPSVTVGGLHSRVAPVHFYRFDLAPRLMHVVGLGATHGIELFALFNDLDTLFARSVTAFGGRKPFISAGERMRRHWLHFACTGVVEASWPNYTEQDRQTLIFDEVDRVECDPRGEQRQVWQEFWPTL
ncbi:carboxylesterase/lipase family protein [Cryobacterium sp. CG_9.6]|uniref:carboxylesterase/lipase family protein n=1 Tax=Cryobacterium sp. CG_9.6 TaxID=2760710 RepID=UPI0024741BC9|nr:carboxylesterase/lipase family protein [Cryobacterium sp. CG_9.6]MDH6235614.1 para-nitrobenzyl esterase [Cryobacterium sp. CG_9.6]